MGPWIWLPLLSEWHNHVLVAVTIRVRAVLPLPFSLRVRFLRRQFLVN
jgi:hypothetical protein